MPKIGKIFTQTKYEMSGPREELVEFLEKTCEQYKSMGADCLLDITHTFLVVTTKSDIGTNELYFSCHVPKLKKKVYGLEE